jgi:hypothetical protein
MHTFRICWLIAICALSGCATMNPYVQHSRDVPGPTLNACMGKDPPHDDLALKYTCEMSVRMEKARSEIVTTRSGLTAAMFPLAGIVGYNSARGFNAPTNAALTAAGFAGYGAITTLAQPDRIRVYDGGLRSLYCAMGVYQTAVASKAPESVGRVTLKVAVARTRYRIDILRSKNILTAAGTEKLNKLSSFLGDVGDWLKDSNPDRSVSAQLFAFSRSTVAKVNSQLTLTVPDNRQLAGDALSVLQSGTPQASDKTLAFKAMKLNSPGLRYPTVPNSELDDIEQAVEDILALYEALASKVGDSLTQLKLTGCEYADSADIAVKDAITRLMLGPGDVYSGATVKVVRGSSFDVTISGGVLPYTATISAVKGTDDVSATVAGGQMKIAVKTKPGTVPLGRYQVIVNDATNRYSKWMLVEVPENP